MPMEIYGYPGENRIHGECVLALGFFDGVHIAHRELIKSARDVAEERGLPLGIFTFAGGIKPGARRIFTDSEKCEIFESLGADFVVFAIFDAIKGVTAEDFVKDILIKEEKCAVCVAGFNFRFGCGASGDARMLVSLMKEGGGEAIIKSEVSLGGECVSSTRIRGRIEAGEMQYARELLGIPYYIKGRVEGGRRVGRTLGFPTVNLPISDEKAVPRCGVYRSAVLLGTRAFSAITNVGSCPTFEGREVHSESYILDFEGDIYGEEIKVFLLDFMREEIAFSSHEALKMQINIDKNNAILANGDIKWLEHGLK